MPDAHGLLEKIINLTVAVNQTPMIYFSCQKNWAVLIAEKIIDVRQQNSASLSLMPSACLFCSHRCWRENNQMHPGGSKARVRIWALIVFGQNSSRPWISTNNSKCACENGDYTTVRRILEENAKFSINVTNQLGRTTLQLAIDNADLEVWAALHLPESKIYLSGGDSSVE